jgi:ABC-type bacteriocin/lantibiotic exporter with double-glycine peptidase domain
MQKRKSKLKPPFHKQEKPHTCAVACLRMILEMHGLKIDEDTLSERCRTTTYGTLSIDLVQAARDLGFGAHKENASLNGLRQYLTTNIFPILFINLLAIDGYNTTHAVILEEISEEEIKIIDPRMGSRTIDGEIFEYSWRRAKNIAVIVQKV